MGNLHCLDVGCKHCLLGNNFNIKEGNKKMAEYPKHDHNSIYTRKDVCTEKHSALKEGQGILQTQITDNKKELKIINNKINATLIFAICTLVGIIMLFLRG